MRRKMSRRVNRGLGLRAHVGIGRPSKMTPDLKDKFLASIRAGNHRETAAKFAGISPATLYRWLADDRGPYRDFFEDVERAEAEVEQAAVASVMAHIPDDPKLALAYLAKRFPRQMGAEQGGAGSNTDGAKRGSAATSDGENGGSPSARGLSTTHADRSVAADAGRKGSRR